jgi:predicted dehydrogenase
MPPTTLPSATPTVLIIGAGGIGERHVRCFLATARTGVALCEPNVDRRKLICERYGVAGFATAAEALATARFRAAVICTPAPRHPAIAAECLAAGLSVLIEKPLAASHEGLDSLRQALARSQGILRVAYVYRSIPVIQACRELVQSETLGKVRHVTVEAGQNFPSFRPDFQRTYYAKRASGGGAIQDFLTHMVHGVEWTVGPVVELACLADRQVLSGVEVEDVASLLCRHRDGTLSSFSLNQFQAPNEVTLSYHAPGGSIRVELHRQRLGVARQGSTDWEWREIPHGERDTLFVAQANSFLDACEGKPDQLCCLDDAVQTLEVNLCALASNDSRQFIRVAP